MQRYPFTHLPPNNLVRSITVLPNKMKFACLLLFVALVHARPQFQQNNGPAEPYDFQYKVENPPTNTYFGQNENGDQAGNKQGSFYVLLPDGRTMTVNYVANANGFVPKISFGGGAPGFQG